MTKKETIDFMNRIKAHYQDFIIDDFKVNEWFRELQHYDREDLDIKFDEHLSSEMYGQFIPKLFFMTKYLIKTADKGKIIHRTVICTQCKNAVNDWEFDKHFKKCSGSCTIARDMNKYFNTNLDPQDLMEYSDTDFERMYKKYLNKMIEAPIPDFRKKIILKCIYPEMEMEDLGEMIKENIVR